MNDQPRRSNYYPALDGFRAIAVLMVFSVHYVGEKLPLLGNWGWMGVDFFFVLSGFLITGILFDSRQKQHRFRDFYARRILRIFPLYYGVWLLLLLAYPIFRWNWSGEWLLWPFHLGNLARFIFLDPANLVHLDILLATRHNGWLSAIYPGHFWSLCIEEQFYLIWPMVVLFARSRRALIVLSAAIVVAEPFLRLGLLYVMPGNVLAGEFLARFTLTRLDALLLGGLLALLLRGRHAAVLHRYGRVFTLSSIVLFALSIVLYVHRTQQTSANLTDGFLSTFGLSAVALLGAGILLELIREGSVAGRWLSVKPLRRLGQVSYGFYVFHDLPHTLYARLALPFGQHHAVPTALIALVCTLSLSFLSFRYFESPFLKLKSRFAGQVHRAPEA